MSKATMKAKAANSDLFYRAKDDLFFCTQVVALASVAAAATRSMALIDGAGAVFGKELERVKAVCPGVEDWREMPDESIHWTLTFAAQRMEDAANRMESAFMAAEQEGGNQAANADPTRRA